MKGCNNILKGCNKGLKGNNKRLKGCNKVLKGCDKKLKGCNERLKRYKFQRLKACIKRLKGYKFKRLWECNKRLKGCCYILITDFMIVYHWIFVIILIYTIFHNGSWSTLATAKNTVKRLKNDQFFATLAGYKWSKKVTIFSKVKEKG